jgi:hypothetical protein
LGLGQLNGAAVPAAGLDAEPNEGVVDDLREVVVIADDEAGSPSSRNNYSGSGVSTALISFAASVCR